MGLLGFLCNQCEHSCVSIGFQKFLVYVNEWEWCSFYSNEGVINWYVGVTKIRKIFLPQACELRVDRIKHNYLWWVVKMVCVKYPTKCGILVSGRDISWDHVLELCELSNLSLLDFNFTTVSCCGKNEWCFSFFTMLYTLYCSETNWYVMVFL